MIHNVLVFPCGSVPAVEINFALRDCLRVNLFGASSIDDHGEYVYKNYIGNLPNIKELDFIARLNKIIKENDIHFIIPTHDTVVLYLLENDHLINAKIVSADLETSRLCRSKRLTYDRFSGTDFVPKLFPNEQQVQQFPVFLKPDQGQGGKGAYFAGGYSELVYNLQKNSDLLICEYLPGEELTVDCFTDQHSELLYVGPRTRDRIFGGISVRAKTVPLTPEIKHIAEVINKELDFKGYWFFQLKKDIKGSFKLLEISTRFAGNVCLNRNLDINFPLLSVLVHAEEEVEILPNEYMIEVDRTLISRFKLNLKYQRVYIDFDDTILLRAGKYNKYVMMFLFQCLNEGKELILITKHEKDIKQTLDNSKISPQLFNTIIIVKPKNKKYLHMDNSKPSIFIDNSFLERKLVKDKLKIPTFDISNIECLIDWRG